MIATVITTTTINITSMSTTSSYHRCYFCKPYKRFSMGGVHKPFANRSTNHAIHVGNP